MKFTISTTIKTSLPEAFRYLTSSSKLGEWMKDFQSIKTTSGRRTKVGGVSKLIFKDAKSAYSIKEEVLGFERNERFEIELEHTEIITRINYRFGAKDARTTILVADYQVKFKNPLNRIFGIFFKIPMRNQQQEDLTRLKNKLDRISNL
ncbi:MAG: SRPBCC family protein [Saprospiraceae bacterium]